jgi:putative DNA primase/helicase
MASVQTETAGDGPAAAVNETAATVSPPSFIAPRPVSQETRDLNYLYVGFMHACALFDDIELGLDDETLNLHLQALNRVRVSNLNADENEVLNVLLANEIKQRGDGVQRKAIALLGLKENYAELATLADAIGNLPYGATWANMAEALGPITWAWKPWLSPGFLTLVVSEPGRGKSMLCLRIAACFLRGDPWPDGALYTGEAGAVVWCEAEAAQALNLERAKSWGLPLEKIYTPLDDPLADVQLDIPEHQQIVRTMMQRPEVRLLVVDSLRGAHQGDENSSTSMETVKWLAELARDTSKPVLLTHHLRKRGLFDIDDKVSLDRVRGSSAIIQTARLVWAIDQPDPGSETRRLSIIKNNMARFPEPVGLTIGDLGLSFGDAPEKPKEDTPVERAIDLLRVLLDDSPMRQPDIEDEAKGSGISWASMRRAKKQLGVVSKRQPDGWYWSLPIRGVDNDTPSN